MIRTLATLSFLLASTTSVWAETAEKHADKAAEKPAAAAATAPKEAAKADAKDAGKDAKAGEIATLNAFKYEPKDSDVVYGKDDAPVTMVEYASYSCSHCGQFYKEVFPTLEKNYIETGKLRLVFRSFPLNQPALDAAQMVHCSDKAQRQSYVKVLFNTQEKWAYDVSYRESLAGIAVLGGMERSKFDACLADKEVQSAVLLVYQEAQTTFKVDATPTLFLGSEIIKGDHSLATVVRAVDKALAAAAKK